MSEKVLSQEEISALLGAVGGEEIVPGSRAAPQPTTTPRRVDVEGREGCLFPMVQANELSREAESGLLLIFDTFSHKGSASFSHTLRTQVAFRLQEVEQIYYGDFIDSLPEPSSMWYLSVKPLGLHVAVCLEPQLVNLIVSVMLGGGNVGATSKPRQQITDLEQSIVETAVTMFCKELSHAWSRILEVTIEIDNRETRPRLLRIYPPSEALVTLGMSMKVGSGEGTLYWGLPGGLVKALQDAIIHQRQVESREKLVEMVGWMKTLAGGFSTGIEARLAETPVAIADLLGLRVGDVIKLEHLVAEPAHVLLNGRSKFIADIVLANERKALRLVDPNAKA
jgi:flagellar motor switch protein FliM